MESRLSTLIATDSDIMQQHLSATDRTANSQASLQPQNRHIRAAAIHQAQQIRHY